MWNDLRLAVRELAIPIEQRDLLTRGVADRKEAWEDVFNNEAHYDELAIAHGLVEEDSRLASVCPKNQKFVYFKPLRRERCEKISTLTCELVLGVVEFWFAIHQSHTSNQ